VRLVPPARAAAGAACVALLVLTGCSESDGATPAGAGDDVARSQILQPGRPGEGNQTLDPETTLESAPWNDADATFMQMMVPHHAQALEMSELAETRAADASVASLARRIRGSQGPEIRSMAAWLAARELAVPESHSGMDGMEGMEGMDMMGMLTEEQMAELEQARGARFDQLFLAGMIQHHQGAIDMAGQELEAGSDLLALELAAEISTGQLAEIDRMEDLREQL
jgi:uncharacterized protein (DUF305 family)